MTDISDLTWWQWIVFLTPIVLLVSAALWILVFGRRPRYPEGNRITRRRGRYTVQIVCSDRSINEDTMNELGNSCAIAVWSTGTKWKEILGVEALTEISEVCIYFADDAYFESQPFKSTQKSAAFLVNTGAHIGVGIPMAVVRQSLIGEVVKTGEPIIHEMLHACSREFTTPESNRAHSDKRIWIAAGGESPVQFRARKLFWGTFNESR